MQTKLLSISGLHCQACKTLIETEIKGIKGVRSINVDLANNNAELKYDGSQTNVDVVIAAINKLNYSARIAGPDPSASDRDPLNFKKRIISAVLAVAGFALAYYLISAYGAWELMGRLNDPQISLAVLFLIGVIASFHCVGMCGGIIVSFNQGARAARRPLAANLSYNLGRLLSYSTVGFLLGAFGSLFNINPGLSGALALLAAGFMLIFGLSMIFEHKWFKKILPRVPDKAARLIFTNKKNGTRGPFFIGLATALMPCGPMQAVQIFALSTGNAWTGALAMGTYALGTVPLLLGFGQVISWFSRERLKTVMRFSGVLVILLALIMFNRSLNFFGYSANIQDRSAEIPEKGFQEVRMSVGWGGYQPNVLYVEKDIPVRWIIDGAGISGCTNEILLPDYGIKQKLSKGETIIEFTPDRLGEIRFSCWMKMVWGKFIVR